MTDTATLRRWHTKLLDALARHEAAARRVQESVSDGYLTPEGARDSLDKWAAQGRWMEDIADVDRDIDAWLDRAEHHIARVAVSIRQPVEGTATEQLLAETRAVRSWERLRAQLDAENPVAALMQYLDAVRGTTGDERRVLIEEGPTYLHGRGIDDIDANIDSALADTVPEYRAALEYRVAARAHAGRLKIAVKTAREHASGLALAEANGPRLDLHVARIAEVIDANPLPDAPTGV